MTNEAQAPRTVLVVDDTPENIDILNGVLNQDYRIKVAINGPRALEIARSGAPPDLILLDVMMPGMDGHEVCRQLKSQDSTRNIPVIFVTARNEVEDEELGFELGAVDYITKPISPATVRARVRTQLALYDQNRALQDMVRQRTDELTHTQDVTILGLATLAEYRDNETGGHIMRTQQYVRIIAERLATRPAFRHYLDPRMVDLLSKSAPLHDIGKVAIRDSILLKPGKLSAEEFEVMKEHTTYGRDTIVRSEVALGRDREDSFLRLAREISYTHHEKWDGSGYPQGLVGTDIPLIGRLMSIADVYDALISKRVYKPPFSHREAVRIITQGDGRTSPEHFDPTVLEIFEDAQEEFRKNAYALADHEEERAALS
jgi:putative two-component system response regulator